MTKKVAEVKQQATGVDLIWDSWLNNFKTLQSIQAEVERKSFRVFDYQKELIDSTRKTLDNMETESNKLVKEWSDRLEDSVKASEKIQSELSANWLSTIEEINNKVQSLAWSPSHAVLDLFTQSQAQLETTVKEAVQQQKEGRTEVLKQIEDLTIQLKQSHKGVLETVKA
ncbi:hypothetical protein MHZ95_04685 [Sporosarcina sp. ACRSM]|uniref:hypothetical protein n=1 Tax=Sporosarcina sp. ACRSM TaxID=2918216 RepID=UPI001EF414CA|nr:hypothetical protein [Sporosarcina sp. ACRSM]MCG7334577.1 hypothetical protein [Sporosarcina sp. ACRSM]